MLLGIGLHAALSFVPFPWMVQDSRQHELFGLLFFAIHGFRMPLFFVISGFFTAMLCRQKGLAAMRIELAQKSHFHGQPREVWTVMRLYLAGSRSSNRGMGESARSHGRVGR